MVALTVIVGLVLLTSAACSLFEAVLYAVPASRVEALDRAGRPAGRTLKRLRQEVDRPIAAILSLNTLANTGGGALAGALAAGVLGVGWLGYFFLAFTLAILFVSEVVPKTIGVVYAAQLAPFIARPLQWLVVAFRPFIWLTRLATKTISKKHENPHVSDEDILTLLGLGVRSGDFKPHEARVIRNVLSLENKTARSVMTPRSVVFALRAESTAGHTAKNPELNRYSRVPVYAHNDHEDLVGVVHRMDILTAVANDEFEKSIEQLMRPIHFVADTAALDELLRNFLERRQHLSAVIDEFGGLAGIVTLEDVLEEILGREIIDESDQVMDLRAFAQKRRKEILNQRSDEPPTP